MFLSIFPFFSLKSLIGTSWGFITSFPISSPGAKKKKDTLKRISDDPFFDAGEYDKLGQIPDYWFWDFVRTLSTSPISLALIDHLSAKSNTVFRDIFLYFSGMDKTFPLAGELYEQACLRHVIRTFMSERGDLLNRSGGFFNRDFSAADFDMFGGEHGIFAWYPSEVANCGMLASSVHSLPTQNWTVQYSNLLINEINIAQCS